MWEAHDHFSEFCRVVSLYLRSESDERVLRELITLATDFLTAWRTIEHSLALDDAYGLMPGEAERLQADATRVRRALNTLAPSPADKPGDASAWGSYSSTPAIGAAASRRKVLAIVGRAFADSLEPSLVRRFAHLENDRTNVPPLEPDTVDALVDWCLERHVGRTR